MGWFARKTIGNILAMATGLIIIHTFVRVINQVNLLSLFNFLLYCVAFVGLILLLAVIFFYLRHFVPLRKREPGFEYVYVENDGTVREVSEDDQAYLNTHFSPGDGGRPSIKTRYKSRNGWGNISGFIPRRRVPRQLPISPYIPGDKPQANAYYCQ
jgi:hypothetical protein